MDSQNLGSGAALVASRIENKCTKAQTGVKCLGFAGTNFTKRMADKDLRCGKLPPPRNSQERTH